MYSSTRLLWLAVGAAVAVACPVIASAQQCPEFIHDCQSTNWQWVGGTQELATTATYAGDPAAVHPGTITAAVTWTTPDGNLWLFGGSGYTASSFGYLNDLWQYDPDTGHWTWVKGSQGINQGTIATGAAEGHCPGARSVSNSWTDSQGNLWLFGGEGYDSTDTWGYLSDVWKFDVATGNWMHMHGSTNRFRPAVYSGDPATLTPGSFAAATSWVHDGDLWLFGGYHANGGLGSGDKNDLWKFDTSTNQWTLVKGDGTSYHRGNYTGGPGDLLPMARRLASFSVDSNGDVWLFGGLTNNGKLNDLWKYSPATGNWSLLHGTSGLNSTGVYAGDPGTLIPSARHGASSWIDAEGRFVLFGGRTTSNLVAQAQQDDLWIFNSKLGHWQLKKGDNAIDAPPVYSGDPTFLTPGARYNCPTWTGTDGSLMLFAGIRDGNSLARFGDIWKLAIGDCGPVPMHFNAIENQPAYYIPPMYDPAGSGLATVDVYPAHGTADRADGTTDTIIYTPDPDYVGEDSFVIATGGNGCPVDVQTVTVTVIPANEPPVITAFSANPPAAVTGQVIGFNTAASDPNSDQLSLSFDYGDGASDNTGAHAYSLPGIYLVTVTVTDGEFSASLSTYVLVAPADRNRDGLVNGMDTDSDFDGFSDTVENSWGTSPLNTGDTPTGALDPGLLDLVARKPVIPGKTPKPGKMDKVTIAGYLSLPADVNLAGQRVAFNLAGNVKTFVLDTKGQAKLDGWSIKVIKPKAKAGQPLPPAQFQLKASGFLYNNFLLNSPLDPNGKPARLTLEVLVNGRQYTGTQAIAYKP